MPSEVTWVGSYYTFIPTVFGLNNGTDGVIAFDVVGVGNGNSLLNIVDNFPIVGSFSFTTVVVVTASNAGSTYFNIGLGSVALTGTTPLAGQIATVGQQVFTTEQLLPTPGVVTAYTVPVPTAIWPSGYNYSTLTLRVDTTQSTGGVGGIKVAFQ
jgi:hypothetical protein